MAIVEVEIVSDPVCVWCFVGKRTLDKAISMFQKTYPDARKDVFHLTWQPYYLGHYPHEKSVDKTEFEKIKFKDMTTESVQRLRNRMNQIGRSVGINYKYGGKIGHTRNAHRLIHFVQTKHSTHQDAVIEGIFSAFHEKEEDITDLGVLRDIAVNAGIDGDEVMHYLNSDVDKDLTDGKAQANREQVTSGVPAFLIQKKYRVDGAQDLQEFVEAFIKVREQEAFVTK